VQYKEKLEPKIRNLMQINVSQVIATGPLIVSALDALCDQNQSNSVLTEEASQQEISEYRNNTLRFIRTNYELFIDHFKTQVLAKEGDRSTLNRYFESDLLIKEWKIGLTGLNEEVFDLVQAYV